MIGRLKTIPHIFILTKKFKTTVGFTVHNARKQIPCLLSSHLLNEYYPPKQFPRVYRMTWQTDGRCPDAPGAVSLLVMHGIEQGTKSF